MQRKRIALSLVAGVLSEGANKLIPLATLHLAATRLGVKPFGLSQFSQWLTDLGIYFVAFGFSGWAPIAWRNAEQALASDSTSDHQAPTHMNRATIFSAVTIIRLIHALIACTFLYFAVQGDSGWSEYRWILIPTLFIVVFSAFDSLWAVIYLRAIPLFSGISIATKILSLIAIVILVQGPDDALNYTLSLHGANALLSMASFVYIFHKVGWTWPSKVQITTAFKKSTPFAISSFLLVALERIDLALVESALGPAGAGAYGGPMKIAISLMPIAGMVATVFFSEMLSIYDNDSMQRHLRAGLRVAILILAPLAVGVWFVYEAIVPLILGPEFAAFARILPILCTCIIAQMFIVVFGNQVLALRGRVALYNWALLAGLFSVIGASHLLGNRYGLEGFAAASAAGRWVAATLATVFGLLVMGSGRRKVIIEVGHSLIPAAIMAGALSVLPEFSWYDSIGVGAAIYVCTTALLFRGFLMDMQRARRNKGLS